MKNAEALHWIEALHMQKHPEGGYFSELYKSPVILSGLDRHLATSIYFLLADGEKSRFHRLKSDELWYYHAGGPIIIYLIDPAGNLQEIPLGTNVEAGESLQVVIPAGSIFGAKLKNPDGFSLVGCMVCPGFEYEDFELPGTEELLGTYPQYHDIILELS